MNFRSRISSTVPTIVRKNDGLPIVNGRKVQRRNGGDGYSGSNRSAPTNDICNKDKYFKGHNNGGNNNYNYSYNDNRLRWMITVAFIFMAMIGIFENNNSNETSNSSSNNSNTAVVVVSTTNQEAAAAATTTSKTTTTTPPPPVATNWIATKFPPDQCTKEQLDATSKQLPDSLYCSR
jgi:hypothetical protein